jgi:hypothetical protein
MREVRNPNKTLVGKFHLQDIDVDRRTTLYYISEKKQEGRVWTRIQWRAVANMLMNLRVLQDAGNSLNSLVIINFSRSLLYAIRYSGVIKLYKNQSSHHNILYLCINIKPTLQRQYITHSYSQNRIFTIEIRFPLWKV